MHKQRLYKLFSNSLIIHDVVTQPECLILVRWMNLETQWKSSCKTRLEMISNPCVKCVLLICIFIIHKARPMQLKMKNFI